VSPAIGWCGADAGSLRDQTILQARIVHLQPADEVLRVEHPEPELGEVPFRSGCNCPSQYIVVEVERVVTGRKLSGTILVWVQVLDQDRGVLRLGGKVGVLDPSYWRVGSSVSVALTQAFWVPSTSDENRSWRGTPVEYTSSGHLFLVDSAGFVIDADDR